MRRRFIRSFTKRSILVLAMNYYQADPPRPYRIAKYALGDDYHNVIYRRLKKLCRFMGHNFGSQQKPYVDTGPLLEKPLAEAAGLGWQGKSTILIEPKRGTVLSRQHRRRPDLPTGEAVRIGWQLPLRVAANAGNRRLPMDARRCVI